MVKGTSRWYPGSFPIAVDNSDRLDKTEFEQWSDIIASFISGIRRDRRLNRAEGNRYEIFTGRVGTNFCPSS